MKRSVPRLLICTLAFSLPWPAGAVAATASSAVAEAVDRFLHVVAHELSDPCDQVAMEQLMTGFAERGTLVDESVKAWILLTFDQHGALEAVKVNADLLLAAPPLIQRAAVLHELEHLKRAKETRRQLDGSHVPYASQQGQIGIADPPPATSKLQHIVRILVEDELRAYRRDILYVYDAVKAYGGLDAYLATLPPASRAPTQRYYQQHVEPFITADGKIDEQRLCRDFIFLKTFPRHYPRYYEAALMWEALEGHVEVRRGQDGTWYPSRFIMPTAFLAWLAPS